MFDQDKTAEDCYSGGFRSYSENFGLFLEDFGQDNTVNLVGSHFEGSEKLDVFVVDSLWREVESLDLMVVDFWYCRVVGFVGSLLG